MRFSYKVLLYVCCMLICTTASAQQNRKQGQSLIDSLLTELPKMREDTSKVELLRNLSYYYSTVDNASGIKYGEQAYTLADKLQWENGRGKSLNSLANNYMNMAEYSKAMELLFRALDIYEKANNKNRVSSVMTNIAIVYTYQGNYALALTYNLKSLKICEELNDKEGIASINGNIGAIYDYQGNSAKALEYYLKAIKINRESGNKESVARNLGNIGAMYDNNGNYSKALEYFSQALEISRELGDKRNIAIVTGNIGNVYDNQGHYLKALEYYFRSVSLCKEMGSNDGIARNLGNIGKVYAEQKNYKEALQYYSRALNMARETGDERTYAYCMLKIGNMHLQLSKDTAGNGENFTVVAGLNSLKSIHLHNAVQYLVKAADLCRNLGILGEAQEAYLYLAEAYKLSGKYREAIEAQEQYILFKDSAFNKENTEKIAKLEVRTEYETKVLTDSLKNAAEKKISVFKLQRQRIYTYLGLACIGLLLSFTFFITKNNKLLAREKIRSESLLKRSDNLLLNILPVEVASELKDKGVAAAKHYNNVTVLFTDFVNFTQAGERMSPQGLIDELHTCFKAFDEITGKYNIEKIKTIGDAYLAVCGLPLADPKHAENSIRAAIDICSFMEDRQSKLGERTFAVRVGINSGSVVAGIVGVKKFAYDIWGDTVNTAARMEQNSEAGRINISQTTYELVKDTFTCEHRGEIHAKGKGSMNMYFISPAKASA